MSKVAKSQNELFKKAAVIGSGFGGLALAIRLQSAGIQTTILEGRDKPGGRAYYWEKEGFIFDGGPTVITDPDCLSQLWELTGNDMAKDIELMPVSPFYRLNWPDGTNFDYVNSTPISRRSSRMMSRATRNSSNIAAGCTRKAMSSSAPRRFSISSR